MFKCHLLSFSFASSFLQSWQKSVFLDKNLLFIGMTWNLAVTKLFQWKLRKSRNAGTRKNLRKKVLTKYFLREAAIRQRSSLYNRYISIFFGVKTRCFAPKTTMTTTTTTTKMTTVTTSVVEVRTTCYEHSFAKPSPTPINNFGNFLCKSSGTSSSLLFLSRSLSLTLSMFLTLSRWSFFTVSWFLSLCGSVQKFGAVFILTGNVFILPSKEDATCDGRDSNSQPLI